MPQITVIIVTYNSGRYLARCLESLRQQSLTDFDVILFDNGSSDGALASLGALPEGWRVIECGENLGFAGANNRAIAETTSPLVFTLNPDAFLEPDCLAQLAEAADRHGDTVMFGASLLSDAAPDRFDGFGDVYHCSGLAWRGGFGQPAHPPMAEGEPFSVCAAAALYRRQAVTAVGGFAEAFFCYLEDVDLGFRLRLAGGKALQIAAAQARHVGSASTGRHSAFTAYHQLRNTLWTFVRNMPTPLFVVLAPLHMTMLFGLLVLATRRGHLAPAWRGLRDGLTGLSACLADRRGIQAKRRVSWSEIARYLTWSPLAPFKRRIDLRPK